MCAVCVRLAQASFINYSNFPLNSDGCIQRNVQAKQNTEIEQQQKMNMEWNSGNENPMRWEYLSFNSQ